MWRFGILVFVLVGCGAPEAPPTPEEPRTFTIPRSYYKSDKAHEEAVKQSQIERQHAHVSLAKPP